jgi:tetratricopeptide (TPR) repeat protein
MPKPVERPRPPKDNASTDELYFTGQRIEQLYSPSFEAQPYYEEILRRDPGDYRANTALGILLCKQWRWEEAAKHLSNAIARAAANHIRPKHGEAFYYLGVALRQQNRRFEHSDGLWREQRAARDAAAAAFFGATWSHGWKSPALLALAEWDSGVAALDYVDQSLQANQKCINALNLKASTLRTLSRLDAAHAAALEALALDPLNLRAHFELALLEDTAMERRGQGVAIARWGQRYLQGNCEAALELATEYANAGLHHESQRILEMLAEHKAQPVVYYRRAYFSRGMDDERRMELYEVAAKASLELSFPLRFEDEAIYRHAMGTRQRDANTPYLLGCLLYDNQPENAIKAWEESRQRDDKFALTHRNLALGYAQHEKNIPKAIASLEKAVELNPKEPRFFYELDVQYEAGGTPVARRLEMLTRHHDTVAGRDDALTREIVLLTVAGRPERALALLRGRHFRNWEGSSQIHNVYVDACLAHGQQLAAEKKSREALAAYQAALEYPENLEVGKARRSPRTAQIQYLIGTAHAALGDAAAAKSAFEKAAAGRDRGATESSYFHALALQKLDRADEAKPIFERLVKAGGEQLTQGEAPDYFAKFGEKTSERVRQANAHYLIGLGQLGLGRRSEAEAAFQKALELHPAHLGSTTALREVAQAK